MTIRKIKNLVLLALLMTAPGAWAETIDCTAITTLPYVITTQGIYCFTGNLATSMTSGNAIEIQTNNVTIDLNGWKLGGLAAGTGTQTMGIYASQRKNITIRNGIIRGFLRGIWLDDGSPYTTSQGHLIEDIRADQNTLTGIDVRGRGSIVRRNQVVDTRGPGPDSPASGITLYGPGVRALNNDISGTAGIGIGGARGLYIYQAIGAVAQDNRIDDVSSENAAPSGILIRNSNYTMARGNSISRVALGIAYLSSASGKYKDTLTNNVSTAYAGGIDAGGNN